MRLRDFQRPGRSVSVAGTAMAATSHPLATLAAIDILRRGGTAIDAAVAAVALQSVIDPLMTSLGGDCFALYAPTGQKPVALNGSGPSPSAADPEALRGMGLSSIPENSPHAVTIPGGVDAWCRLNETYGTLPLVDVLEPALVAARDGFCVTPRVAFDWEIHAGRVARHAPARQHYLPEGKAPAVGQIFRQPALAATIEAICRDGRSGFYEGPVAEDMVATLRAEGGVHQLSDFADYAAFFTEPIGASYKGYEVLECPPNGQGLAALLVIRLLDGFDFADPRYSDADRIHLHAEATKLGYAMRDAVICDPNHKQADIEAILSEDVLAPLRAQIRLDRAAPAAPWTGPTHRDTVYVSVVDKDGNAASLINSVFSSFGSGIFAPNAGVLLQNRGCGFSLAPGHANELGPSKLPFHTIIPAMLMRNGVPVMPFGVMGGQYQAAGHAHFLSRLIDMGLDPQQANEAPRSFWFGGELELETTIPDAVRADLEARGHKTKRAVEPIGGCQAIWIDRDRGVLLGASDHRKDGMALGY